MKLDKIILLICLFTSNIVCSQSIRDVQHLFKPELDNSTKFKSLYIHDSKSKYPDSIEVNGIITKISKGFCGEICQGGTIKVKLKNKISGYNHNQVYIITACMVDNIKIGTRIKVIATKYSKSDNACYYSSVNNIIDSKGIPFYKLSELETSKIKSL